MSIYMTAQELEAICGREAAGRLLAAYGGTRVYVPGALADDHPLVAIMGLPAATAFAAELAAGYSGTQVALPLGPHAASARRQELLRAAVAQGGSAAKIARRLGISIRTVFREKRRQRLEAAQKGTAP